VIVYNVDRQWFTMKSDADIKRRNLGLPPSALITLRVDDRDDLAFLLNGLCGIPLEQTPVTAREIIQCVAIAQAPVSTIPDCIPLFLRKDWERRNKRKDIDE